ncbi:MAG: hypothetical protein O7F76_02225, partial [Planctomycetota bacterium]|nr:hypothetical protein [Planctomycetota bacterium]
SDWGRLFRNWENVTADERGYPAVGESAAEIRRTGFRAFLKSMGILGMCVREAPEFVDRRRKVRASGQG